MKRNEKRYNIVARTNQYLANRLGEFNGHSRIVKAKNLTLKQAQMLADGSETYDVPVRASNCRRIG